MSEIINGVPIGDLPGIESVPDDSMLVVEFLGKAYHMPGAVLRQMIQDVLDSMGDSVDDVTEARLTAAIETVLSSGKYNGFSPIVEVLDEEDGTSVIHIIDAFGVKKYPVEVKGARNAVQYVPQKLTDAQKAQVRENIGVGDGTGTADAVQYVPQTLTTEQQTQARNNIGIPEFTSGLFIIENPNYDLTSQHVMMDWGHVFADGTRIDSRFEFDVPYSAYELARRNGYTKDEVTFYKEMSSNLGNPKGDSLKIDSDTGTLMLLSANEPIGDGVTIPVFVGKYDTVTFAEIKTAHDAGRVCFLDFNGISIPLLGVNDTEAIFVREINENTDYRVTITADGGKSFTMQDKNISDVYVSGLFSAKYAEAKAAYEAGKACFVTYGALLCPLTVLDEEKAEFVGMLTPHIGMKGILYADGTYNFQYVHSNAVQTVEQSLTEEKKAQARANIGALSTADVAAVLQQAKDSGKFDGKDGEDGEDGYTPVKGKDYFDGYTPVKGKDYFDGANGKSAYAYAQDGGYIGTEAEFAAKLASDSEPLVVTLSGNDTDGYTADKTVAEIYAARNAGRDVYMVGGVVTYQLSYLNSSFAAFSYTMASRNAIEIISVIMMSGVAPTRIHQTIDDSYVKYTAQSLDEEYKLQARSNIGAAAAADIATTKYASTSTANTSYFKISDFGSWGTGAWYQKGFSMLITSRAGETVWFSLSANDSATTARAFRLMNTYSKIAGVYYSVSENAVYVKANAWCNNVTAHILSNIGGDYVPTVASVSGLASDAVEVNIIEFGPTSSGLAVGDSSTPLLLGGSATRPTYNGTDMALSSDLSGYLPLGGGTITGALSINDKLTQGSPSGDASVASMNRFHSDLFVQGNGTAPNTPTVAGFYLGKSTSDENRHMDIVSGGDYSYIDFNKAGRGADFDARLLVNVASGWTDFTWGSHGDITQRVFNVNGSLRQNGTEVLTWGNAGTDSILPVRLRTYQDHNNAVSDPNLATETGFYYVNTATNRPPFSQSTYVDYRVLTTAYSSAWLQQIATDFRCDDMFLRRCENGTWTSWVKIGGGASGNYLPLSGGLMTGSLKFQDSSLPQKSLEFVCGIDAFANGGEMGWQSKADFLSGYALKSDIPTNYAKLKTYNDFVHDSNEITMVPAGYNQGGLYFNYRTASGQYDGNINNYVFCNGKGGTAGVTLTADSFSGTAAKATADGNGRNIVSTYATKDEVIEAANGALIVNLNTNSNTVDKSVSEIKAALDVGRNVYMLAGQSILQLDLIVGTSMAEFSATRATSGGIVVVTVSVAGTSATVYQKSITA